MKLCGKCQGEVLEESKFCSTCGAPQVMSESEEVDEKGETIPDNSQEVDHQVEKTEEIIEDNPQEVATQVENQMEPSHLVSASQEVPIQEEMLLADKGEREAPLPKKGKGKLIGLIVAISCVLILGGALVAYKVVSRRPIEVLDQATVTFKGYDTIGTATYNEKAIAQMVNEKALKKAGIASKDVKGLAKKDKTLLKKYKGDNQLNQKLTKAEKMMAKVELVLSKTEDLTNGGEIRLTAKDKNSQENKVINDGVKKVEVVGLKELTEVTLEDVVDQEAYSFTGFNGFGKLVVGKTPFSKEITKVFESVREDGKLANDDKVKLKVTNEVAKELLQTGKKLKHASSLDVKVTGLKDPMNVGGLGKCLTEIDKLTQAYYDNVSLVDFDLGLSEAELKSIGANISFKAVREESYLRVYQDELKEDPAFEIQSIYKIEATMTVQGAAEKKTVYESRGFLYVPVENEKLNFDSLFAFPIAIGETKEEAVKELKESEDDFQKIEKELGIEDGEAI